MSLAPIQPLQPAQAVTQIQPLKPAASGAGDFGQVVGNLLQDVNQSQNQAADAVAQLAAGKTDNVHQVMIALGKAEVSFNYMLEVRNRLLDAYKQVMQMPI
ncbi:MAG: flagellar hook-basal body complex protein FliE [Candidatus Brocadiia bacterium]|jgi:flagellar hook-basal body complex protein FliE